MSKAVGNEDEQQTENQKHTCQQNINRHSTNTKLNNNYFNKISKKFQVSWFHSNVTNIHREKNIPKNLT